MVATNTTNETTSYESLVNLPFAEKVSLTSLIVLNCILLSVGQLFVSFSVYWGAVTLNAGGVAFQYSMWEGIQQLYNDKIYGISILLTVWSGVWPHVKLLVMLALCWGWLPSGVVANEAEALKWLTFLGKFSFVDVWVVIIIVLALRINESSLPGLDISLWVQAVAEGGVFLFCLAVILSQSLGQTAARWLAHRRVRLDSEELAFASLLPSSFLLHLRQHGRVNVNNDSNANAKSHARVMCLSAAVQQAHSLSQGLHWVLLVSVAMFNLALVLGVFLPIIRVTYAAGGSNFSVIDYSIYSGILATTQPNHVGQWQNPLLAAVGMLLVVLTPLIQSLLLCVLWFRDNSTCGLVETLFGTLQVLRYWSCTDSFLLALLVVSLEISQLLNTSPLGKFVHVYMEPLPGLYVVGVVSVLMGLLYWMLDFERYMQRALNTCTHPRNRNAFGNGINSDLLTQYEPLMFSRGDGDGGDTGSNPSIDI